MKMGSMGADRWTDMAKLIVAFRKFANAFENAWNYDPLLIHDTTACGKINYAVTTVLRV